VACTDDELMAIALDTASARGYPAGLEASIVEREPQARVLLRNPAYARGGGLVVIIEPETGDVLRAIPAL
jgi:hypothetical protein